MSTLEEFEKLNLSIEIMRKEIKRHNKNENIRKNYPIKE